MLNIDHTWCYEYMLYIKIFYLLVTPTFFFSPHNVFLYNTIASYCCWPPPFLQVILFFFCMYTIANYCCWMDGCWTPLQVNTFFLCIYTWALYEASISIYKYCRKSSPIQYFQVILFFFFFSGIYSSSASYYCWAPWAGGGWYLQIIFFVYISIVRMERFYNYIYYSLLLHTTGCMMRTY